jgi:hypothetical protein
MKKFILTGLIVTIGFAPALALAQTSGGGTSGRGTTGNPGTTQPGSPTPGSGTTAPPTPSPSPNTGSSGTSGSSESMGRSRTPDTPSTITNKGECERAGGKWRDTENKCGA